MPFSGPSSYLDTIQEFIAHWTAVNAALAPSTLTVTGGYGLPELTADKTAMEGKINALVDASNQTQGHRTVRDNRKAAVRERMRQFGATVRGTMSESKYVGEVPELVVMGANQGKWTIALRDTFNIWTQINADLAPSALTLTGGYALADYTTDRTDLLATFDDLTDAEKNEGIAVDDRDDLFEVIKDKLVLYRKAVQGAFPAEHALIDSLPALTPPRGHTPDPVVLSGSWNFQASMADLSWTASSDPDLAEYEVRRSGATPYSTATEVVVASLPPGTLAHSTNEGLLDPGSSMGFKVYVVLSTGNEKGSNAVTVTNEDDIPGPP